MRKTALIAPTVLLTLFMAPGCKEETPANEPGEFGDPCVVGEADDTPDGCAVGHFCYRGYCEEECVAPSDCQPVEGWERTCAAGICHLVCDEAKACPQDLGTLMSCDNAGLYCQAKEFESS
jgi:hypothetical protein